ncbi:hypothetical protein [Nocardia terpenica]|uniref:Uncharacterized protein n=1 Tax=Nocardia terpenica TaxID=455432 RepID=A0A6G9Z5D8_9NOCA|nr:hypothetical protein [Nocardia terpenica]QIS20557.1 hypothetical protein F6W96_21925 [Nocardia terpenica]
MSTLLLARAETTKLARLLGISDTDTLEFLTRLPPDTIRDFREHATDLLFDADTARLAKVAAASRLVPTTISAKIAERAFGPVLCAAVAAAVEPTRAVDIAKALPAPFLAETATRLDPRRTADILTRIPTRLVVDVAHVLALRGDHVTLGRFVGTVGHDAMRAAAAVVTDADLLRIGYLLEDKSTMDTLLSLVDDRLPDIIRAAHDQHLWSEGIDLLDTVAPATRARIGDLAAALGDDILDGLITAVADLNAWDSLLPVTGAMSPDSLAVLAGRPAVHTEPALTAIMDAALDQGLWLDLLPLATHLPAEPLAVIARRVATTPDDELADLIHQADAADLWDALIPLALAMTEPDRRRMAGLPVMQDPEVLATVIATATEHDLWSQALPLVDIALTPETPNAVWDSLVQARDEIPDHLRTLLADRARQLHHHTHADHLDTPSLTD